MKSMEALLNKSSKLRDIHGKVEGSADSRQGELIQHVSMFLYEFFLEAHHSTRLPPV